MYGDGLSGAREPQSHRPVDRDGDPATKAAALVMRAAGGAPSAWMKRRGGEALHYAFSAAAGATYGVALEYAGEPRISRGLRFGTALWIGADELALPLAGLARGARTYPWTVHAEMLAAHLVFGLATHIATRAARDRL